MLLSLVAVAPLLCPSFVAQQVDATRGKPAFEEHVVLGGEGDFLQVRRLVLRGTQAEIGRQPT